MIGHQPFLKPINLIFIHLSEYLRIVSDMIQLPSWVTYGKARITYASSGFGGTQYLDRTYYSVGSGGSISTPSIQSLGNYKPELTHSLEFGLDWRFFQ